MNLTARVTNLPGKVGTGKDRRSRFPALLGALVLALITSGAATAVGQSVAREQKQPEAISAAEFTRLIHELSEEGGYFRSDNFTSNETSYLHVVDKLRQLDPPGICFLNC